MTSLNRGRLVVMPCEKCFPKLNIDAFQSSGFFTPASPSAQIITGFWQTCCVGAIVTGDMGLPIPVHSGQLFSPSVLPICPLTVQQI